MSTPSEQIADIMARHRIAWYGNHDKRCMGCLDTSFATWEEADSHVAEAIANSLGLKEEWSIVRVGSREKVTSRGVYGALRPRGFRDTNERLEMHLVTDWKAAE